MKRVIIFICLILVIVLGYSIVSKGFSNDSLNVDVPSYETVEDKSNDLTKDLAAYNKKNQKDYADAISSLNSSVNSFNNSKKKYDDLIEELKIDTPDEGTSSSEIATPTVVYSDKKKYEIDYLLAKLGNYRLKEGVDITLKLTTSSTTDPSASSLGLIICNLNIEVKGVYMNICNFISDIENDDELGFEIRDFAMSPSDNRVMATFVVKDIPLDSETLLMSSTDPTAQTDQMNGDTTTNPNQTSTNTPSDRYNTNANSNTTNTNQNYDTNTVNGSSSNNNTTNTVN